MSKNGFTLLEISIVLTIVALLVSGVLVGQNLIRSSQIRSLSEQCEQIKAAFLNFKMQYNAIPGDFRKATDIWGAADGGDGYGADCTAVASTVGATATCNGNGDGQISQQPGDPYRYETWRAWQQLANAGFVEGNYTAVNHTPSTSNREAVPGENVPEAKAKAGIGFTLLYKDSSLWTNWFPNEYGVNVATIGARHIHETRTPFLSPSDMLSVDIKADDGKPGSGRYQTWTTGLLSDCISTDDPITSTYLVSNNENQSACAFFTIIGYE